MNEEYFMSQSPNDRSSVGFLSEEEIYNNVFSLKFKDEEDLSQSIYDNLYCLNDKSCKMERKSNNNNDEFNKILLIDDYDMVFNKLKINQNDKVDEVNELKINENYEIEDNNIPLFDKNLNIEKNIFHFIENEKDEILITIEVPFKSKEVEKELKSEKIEKNEENQEIENKESKKNKENKESKKKPKKIKIKDKKTKNSKNKKSTKKKLVELDEKEKVIEKVKIEDKLFPFKTGKGIFNHINPIIENSCLIYEIKEKENCSSKKEEIYNLYQNNLENDQGEKKDENVLSGDEQVNHPNNPNNLCLKFTTKKYFIASNGKKKKVKKKRKFKPDDIRKKIKTRFHKTIKNIINENLIKAGSKEVFDFFPQCFIGNISKKGNSNVLDLTYKEILSTDFHKYMKSNYQNSKADIDKYNKNNKVLKYLEDNPEISNRSGFDIVKNIKYKDLLKMYFNSSQFEDSIFKLKDEKESFEYIQEYINKAKTYVSFYSNFGNDEKKESNMDLDEE